MFWPAKMREEIFRLLLAREARGERVFTFYPNDKLGRIKEGAICFMPDEVAETQNGNYSSLIAPAVASFRTEPIFIATDNSDEYLLLQPFDNLGFVSLTDEYTENFKFIDDHQRATGFCMWSVEGLDFVGVDKRDTNLPAKKMAEEWLDGMPVKKTAEEWLRDVMPEATKKLEFL